MQGANRLVWLVWRVIGLHWVTILWNAALRVADRVKARTLLERAAELWVIAVISVIISEVFLRKYIAPEGPPHPILLVLITPVSIMILTMLLAALLIIPIGLINALALLPFGPAFSLFSPFIEVSAESTPPGASTVVQLSWESKPAIVESGVRYPLGGTGWIDRATMGTLNFWDQMTRSAIHMQHSQTYSDLRAIATVVKWMQDRVSHRAPQRL